MSENGERPQWLSFKDAVKWSGVSRQRLNLAIRYGEIEAERGGPGVKARIDYDSLNRWLYQRGLLTRERTTPPAGILERLERLVEGLDQRLEAMDRRSDALYGCYQELSARVDLVFTQLKDAHEQEIARLNREHKQREEVLNAREAIYRAFMGPSQELSSRQVGTMGSLISKCHKDGLSCTDAELIASAVECGFDADTAQRCLDQLKADGRYAMIFSEVES